MITHTDGERVIARFRKHWAMLVHDTIGTILLTGLPFLVWIAASSAGVLPFLRPIPAPWIELLLAFWFLLIWITLAVIWTNYYLDIWVITNRRIINVEQVSLFHRRAAVWNMDRVQNISTQVATVLQTLLGFGTIEVHTAGRPGEGARMEGIPHPDVVRTIILDQIERVGKLEETIKKQDELVHFVSHEVKGHLSKNKAAFASIVEGDYGTIPKDLAKMADLALTDTEKGVKTVMNVLDKPIDDVEIARLSVEEFDLQTSVFETAQSFAEDAKRKGVQLETAIGAESFKMRGDRLKIEEHVIRNLLDNALHYTLKGKIRIELSRTGNVIRLSISDTGVGIAAEDMLRIFTKGGKGSYSSTINAESTGYGLYFAKTIVEAHKGRIWAESEGRDKGSRFFVEFPAI
ncbi:hypothetical protein C4585_00900 [Candidatus Parcubacteria bacterium]|nr:MAG: hypothetical protein C4585_00900 [Candidatus Parcubacteria bacterium]